MTLRDDFVISPAPEARTSRLGSTAAGFWTRLLGALNPPDLLVVLSFCAAGLLLSAAFIRIFPDFGEIAESLISSPRALDSRGASGDDEAPRPAANFCQIDRRADEAAAAHDVHRAKKRALTLAGGDVAVGPGNPPACRA